MTTTNKRIEAPISRRSILSSAVACALAAMAQREVLATWSGPVSTEGVDRNRAELYVFPGVAARTTVIAAAWPVRYRGSQVGSGYDSQVNIHASSKSWSKNLTTSTLNAVSRDENGCRIYVGTLIAGTEASVAYLGVVVEAPNRILGGGSVNVWAERILSDGSRRRIGSPFVSALVAEDNALAKLYHSLSPGDDKVELMDSLAKAIASRARNAGLVGDPDFYGRRLAGRLLPDGLRYDPALPSGFTFAAQNGRHPNEASELVANTILNGAATVVPVEASIRLYPSFPYLSQFEPFIL